MKHYKLNWLAALLVIFAICSCRKEIDRGPVNTAVKMEYSALGSSSVTLTLTPTSEVASYIVAPPVTETNCDYLTMNAIESRDYIETFGQKFSAPFEHTYDGLNPGTTYVIGCLAVNADGVICSPPTFSKFTTAN